MGFSDSAFLSRKNRMFEGGLDWKNNTILLTLGCWTGENTQGAEVDDWTVQHGPIWNHSKAYIYPTRFFSLYCLNFYF